MKQTFVLKLAPELSLATGMAQGYVEDVNTGRAIRFCSILELLTFLEEMIKHPGDMESMEG